MAKKRPAPNLGNPERPVPSFPMKFAWHGALLQLLFDEQIRLIRDHITNARAEDRMVVYLSCPISSRGGGNSATNVEIAKHTQQELLNRWGERVWVLNPAAYQMESKSGRGYFRQHAENLGRVKELSRLPKPQGGDYMRMWTKVLIEDGDKNLGTYFDAFYFQGPSDVANFFRSYGGTTSTAQIESYFSAKFATDADFRNSFSDSRIEWDPSLIRKLPTSDPENDLCEQWEERIKNFIRFYSLRGSVQFSLGSHDEWNIFVKANEMRLEASKNSSVSGGDTGQLLAGFFDGRQIDPGGAISFVSPGYEVV